MIISHEFQGMQPVATHKGDSAEPTLRDRVAVLLAGYGEVRSYRALSVYNIGWVNHDTPFINWSQPNLKQAAKSLITAGAQTILFKPLGWVTDNYETILDVEDAIAFLQRQYPTVTYTRLGCVNDDPDFLKIAAEWANPHIEAMLSVAQHHEHIETRRLDFD